MELHRNLIVAHLTGEATEEERSALARWRSRRPANEEEFRRQQFVWDRLGELAAAERRSRVRVLRSSSSVEPEPAAESGPTGDAVTRGFGPVGRIARHLAWSAAMAAAILLALLGNWSPAPSPAGALGAEDVVTGAGEVVTLTLRDGTVVRLGPESRLSFLESKGPRDVLLEGKAYFAVPRFQENPFRVHTRAGDVKVLGTRFEVEAREGGVQIVVVEGEVEAGLPDNRVNIRRGQMGRLDETTAPVLAAVDNVYLATAWIGEFTAFESTPLTEVVNELETRFDLRIEITDEVLASRTVSGLFINQPPEEMVSNICLAVDAWCSRSGETIQMWLARVPPEAAAPPGLSEGVAVARRIGAPGRQSSAPT